jgi:K+-sensing histidine kinase KdpD
LNNIIHLLKESRYIRLADMGEVTITVTIEKQHAQVIVKANDRDSGLDSKISPLLFSRFALKSFKATGLGLFVAKSIIEAHNARYEKRKIIHTQKKRCQLLLFILPTIIYNKMLRGSINNE